jgi:hypothetical protein
MITIHAPNLKYPLKAVSKSLGDEDVIHEKGLQVTTRFEAFFDYEEGKKIGHWYFAPMPGCCGVVVSHSLWLDQGFRGKGYSHPFQQLRELVARKLGYSCIISTILTNNFPEIISSANSGWRLYAPFRNKRTGNEVTFSIKHI